MVFPLPHAAAGTYTRLAYSQATSTHLIHLLDGIRTNLERYFPHLLPVHWITSLARVSPQLWLAPGVVTMSWDDFMRVTKVAAALPGPWGGDAAGYCPQGLYLARYVAESIPLAHLALAEVEAAPQQYGPHAYQLITQLAAGNSVAQEILHVTAWQQQDLTGPGISDAALTFTPALAALNLGDRLRQLEQARSPQPAADSSASPTPESTSQAADPTGPAA
jgi:hypothetical protein